MKPLPSSLAALDRILTDITTGAAGAGPLTGKGSGRADHPGRRDAADAADRGQEARFSTPFDTYGGPVSKDNPLRIKTLDTFDTFDTRKGHISVSDTRQHQSDEVSERGRAHEYPSNRGVEGVEGVERHCFQRENLSTLASSRCRKVSKAAETLDFLSIEPDPAEAETRAGFLEFDCGLARAEAERMAGARPLVDTVDTPGACDTPGAFDTVDTSDVRVRETPRAHRRVLRPSPKELAVMLGWPLPREGDPPADAVCTTCGLGALQNLGLLTFLDGHFAHDWCPPPARRDTLRRQASAGRGAS